MIVPPGAAEQVTGRLPVALCAFGLTWTCGLVPSTETMDGEDRLDPIGLLNYAAELGLSGVEIPPRLIQQAPGGVRALRESGERLGLGFVIGGSPVLAGRLLDELDLANDLGATVVRCILSDLLCGDRRQRTSAGLLWPDQLRACRAVLAEAADRAERLGIRIAVENHQDADSGDLLELCDEIGSPAVGITLDTGNPLAVMEEPTAFARSVAPHLRHMHLKDYRLHPGPRGVRLVRCALGEGVIDFAEMLALAEAAPHPVSLSLELAAHHARLIPWLDRGWWAGHRERPVIDLLPVLRLLQEQTQPPEAPWQTPVEVGMPPESVMEYERSQSVASARHLHALMGGFLAAG